jgi:hypothetical protein
VLGSLRFNLARFDVVSETAVASFTFVACGGCRSGCVEGESLSASSAAACCVGGELLSALFATVSYFAPVFWNADYDWLSLLGVAFGNSSITVL